MRHKDATKRSAQEVEQLAAAADRGEPVRPADVERNDAMLAGGPGADLASHRDRHHRHLVVGDDLSG
ncbi:MULTISPECIES: hypothetical protein [Pseudonocardia]|uniref:Uncharacterized protein n=1 Tax=Pseudonocardia saturnea TaxID=33909 RepID=A0ABQ0S3I6_9PSEU|nr:MULTISPECIES: hypothetical protein [Pseudonocardia]BBG05349.1 hypothetical protein Pdca_65580 [Pseudonocardia autotrophica]GEC27473.1 hypothetical protein PSA01_45020 [Pseudonocardia saturnea]